MDVDVRITLVSRSGEAPTHIPDQDPVLVVLDHRVVSNRQPPAGKVLNRC